MKTILSLLVLLLVSTIAQTTPPSPILKKSPVPIEGSVMQIDRHDDTTLAANIIIYNGSTKALKAFVAEVSFMEKDTVLLTLALRVEKEMPASENTIWFGAIPFDPRDPLQKSILSRHPDSLSMHIVVQSVTYTNGTTKVY